MSGLQRKKPLRAKAPLQRRQALRLRASQGLAAGRRTALRRSGRVAPVSVKRKAQERDYTALRKAFLADNPWCIRCGARSTDVHHTGGRDGWRLLYVPWWVALDRDCHAWAHANPAAAEAVGLMRKRHGEAA